MSSGFKFLPSLTSAFSYGTDLLTYYIICLFIFYAHTHTQHWNINSMRIGIVCLFVQECVFQGVE